jgi:hypothetical protein
LHQELIYRPILLLGVGVQPTEHDVTRGVTVLTVNTVTFSWEMLEYYSHVRMAAKRAALDSIAT